MHLGRCLNCGVGPILETHEVSFNSKNGYEETPVLHPRVALADFVASATLRSHPGKSRIWAAFRRHDKPLV